MGGVRIGTSGYGSSYTPVPGRPGHFYGLTDRGPNVDAPGGHKIEPTPRFQPAIGEFVLTGGTARLVRRIGLSSPTGAPFNGQVSTEADTGETIEDASGTVLPKSATGYDPEGLAALRDGTFWVSDEYGPYVTHFDARGREIERLSPFNGVLPAELKTREPNKGMEGLTVTPDGRTLVGVMQAALNAPGAPKSKKVSALRIVTIDLRSKTTHEYVYLLHNTSGADTTVSEIAALSDHEFLVDERDGTMPQPGSGSNGTNKKLFRIDLRGASDVGPNSKLTGATYDAGKGGLLIGGKNVEAIAGSANTADAEAALTKAGVTPVRSSLFLDIAALVHDVDPKAGFFAHDKIEGVAVVDGGRRIYLSNDSDFGIAGVVNTAAPWQFSAKTLANGRVDAGEVLEVDMTKVPARFTG